MTDANRIEALREESNPLFNDRPLKLGTICANLSHGVSITTIDGVLDATWPETQKVAQIADAMEFEAQFSVARWLGFGGPSEFNDRSFETFAWAAGLSAETDYSSVLTTSHVTMMHPIVAAKQGATIDHISGGRWALNVVAGWQKEEVEMFGLSMRDHSDRYRLADEWLTIVKRLWTEEDGFDFDGDFFQVKHARIRPQPIQKPYPVLINAAGSETGRHFAAKHCDAVFVLLNDRSPEGLREQVELYRRFAREEYGREHLQVWCNAYVVAGDTEEEAKSFLSYYVDEKGDDEAMENMFSMMGISKTLPVEALRALRHYFIAGYAGYELVGTNEQVVDGFQVLRDCGFDGVLLGWPQYIAGIEQFQREIMPLLIEAGLR